MQSEPGLMISMDVLGAVLGVLVAVGTIALTIQRRAPIRAILEKSRERKAGWSQAELTKPLTVFLAEEVGEDTASSVPRFGYSLNLIPFRLDNGGTIETPASSTWLGLGGPADAADTHEETKAAAKRALRTALSEYPDRLMQQKYFSKHGGQPPSDLAAPPRKKWFASEVWWTRTYPAGSKFVIYREPEKPDSLTLMVPAGEKLEEASARFEAMASNETPFVEIVVVVIALAVALGGAVNVFIAP